MKKAKLIIFQNEVSAYDVENFNNIAECFDLTVAYFLKDKSAMDCHFKKVKLESHNIGLFIIVKGVRELAKQNDVVCILPDLHIISYCILPFLPHRYKIVNWSIGFRVSYIHPYITNRKHNVLDWFFKKVINSCDATIFYMDKAKEFWGNEIDLNKVFVAVNTTQVSHININPEQKKNVLFVGTLYKGKGLETLLETYNEYIAKTDKVLPLIIVGDGSERNTLEKYVSDHNLEHHVSFCGAVFEEAKLAEFYSKAILSVSPNQAGLSVPKSMGYAVPYATRKDAITGGEIYHITDGVNGFMYEKDEDLLNILLDASEHPQKYVDMGLTAKEYYDNNATVKHRSEGAIKAFKYALGL